MQMLTLRGLHAMAYLHFLHLLRGLAVSGPWHPMARAQSLFLVAGQTGHGHGPATATRPRPPGHPATATRPPGHGQGTATPRPATCHGHGTGHGHPTRTRPPNHWPRGNLAALLDIKEVAVSYAALSDVVPLSRLPGLKSCIHAVCGVGIS